MIMLHNHNQGHRSRSGGPSSYAPHMHNIMLCITVKVLTCMFTKQLLSQTSANLLPTALIMVSYQVVNWMNVTRFKINDFYASTRLILAGPVTNACYMTLSRNWEDNWRTLPSLMLPLSSHHFDNLSSKSKANIKGDDANKELRNFWH